MISDDKTQHETSSSNSENTNSLINMTITTFTLPENDSFLDSEDINLLVNPTCNKRFKKTLSF